MRGGEIGALRRMTIRRLIRDKSTSPRAMPKPVSVTSTRAGLGPARVPLSILQPDVAF